MVTWAGTPAWIFVAFTFAFGSVIGSFVNAAVYRLPRNISLLSRTRSFCPQCEAIIHWYDNLPILSYLALRGKCRACGKPIPLRYLVVELLCSSLFALAAYQYFILNAPSAGRPSRMPWILTAAQLFLIADLLCIAFVDLETWCIPILTTYPWIAAGLLLAFFFPELHLSSTEWLPAPAGSRAESWNALMDSFQGLVLGAGIPWAIGFVCVLLLKKEGMGSGDSHLLGMFGAMLGWKPALLTFFIGIFIGCVLGLGSLAWDRVQQARLGERWKPRRPTFELPEGEDAGPPPAWHLLVFGLVVLVFEAFLFWLYSRNPGAGLQEGPLPISAVAGAMLGAFLMLAYPIQTRLRATGLWPTGEVQVREDGKKEEVLQGNYIPFGPSLALAGVAVVFYDPLLRTVAAWWLFRPARLPALPFHLIGIS